MKLYFIQSKKFTRWGGFICRQNRFSSGKLFLATDAFFSRGDAKEYLEDLISSKKDGEPKDEVRKEHRIIGLDISNRPGKLER